jgi:hypothetical protein
MRAVGRWAASGPEEETQGLHGWRESVGRTILAEERTVSRADGPARGGGEKRAAGRNAGGLPRAGWRASRPANHIEWGGGGQRDGKLARRQAGQATQEKRRTDRKADRRTDGW